MNNDLKGVSIVLPCKNEASGLTHLLPRLLTVCQSQSIYVIDDGSNDESVAICEKYGVHVEHHPYSKGNGAAIKTGARVAQGEILVFMDADGQHDPADIPRLVKKVRSGCEMAVGARSKHSQATKLRAIANRFYNFFASWVTGHNIEDLTSGFRAVRAEKFREFIYLYPNGFSYPTTVTMAMIRSGYSVCYVPIHAGSREGKGHIQLVRDGTRFLLIIFKIGTLFSPMKIFFPSSILFISLGMLHYLNTFVETGRFTNMSALLISTGFLVFLLGLISEQITNLMFKK